ncbi:hypothetical protein B0H13DRAFT_2341051 [Mycena leptocephala]|nr:hypothetical protein B0H13DRAFT_2341051 [Mycena leptocephala]
MAHQFGNIIAYTTCFLSESSNWAGELERDPCLAFASSLALARAGAFEILVFGGLNARTGSQTPSVHDPFRVSKDDKHPVLYASDGAQERQPECQNSKLKGQERSTTNE